MNLSAEQLAGLKTVPAERPELPERPELQLAFLTAIERFAPGVLSELADLLPLYSKVVRGSEYRAKLTNIEDPEFADLREPLTAWALRHHLQASDDRSKAPAWIMRTALQTLRAWQREEDRPDLGLPVRSTAKRQWNFCAPAINISPRFTFQYPAWHPGLQTEKRWAEGLKKQFDKELSAFRASHKATLTKRLSYETHARWLIERNILGRPIEKIAAGKNMPSISTVSEGTSGLARILDLAVRRQLPGRRRK